MVDYTYDGDGELVKSKQTVTGNCPDIPAAKGSRLGPGHAHHHGARRAVLSHWYQAEEAWNTALGGVPQLAYEDSSSSCDTIGHSDFIYGPNVADHEKFPLLITKIDLLTDRF